MSKYRIKTTHTFHPNNPNYFIQKRVFFFFWWGVKGTFHSLEGARETKVKLEGRDAFKSRVVT